MSTTMQIVLLIGAAVLIALVSGAIRDRARGIRPDAVIGLIADLPALLERGFVSARIHQSSPTPRSRR